MELRELVDALLRFDALFARQWIADATRDGIKWTSIPPPAGLDAVGMAVAAGVIELLAERAHESPPSWTTTVGPAPRPIFLVRAAETMPRLRQQCETEAPLPLKRRRLLAPAEFLKVA